MKIVITSDTHFGDGTNQLAAIDSSGTPTLGPKYHEFIDACGTNNDCSEWASPIFGKELDIGEPPLTIKNLAHLNFPLSQLSSSRVGQADPLSMILYQKWFEFNIGRPS